MSEQEKEFSQFVHLHCHTDYSLYDGFQKYGSLVKRAKELDMKAVAITDHGKVGSFVKFYKACRKAEIKPIFGIETYLSGDLENKKSERCHLTVLAKNIQGYRNILKLSTESHKHIVRVGRNEIPRINWDILQDCSEGLIILSGCIVGQFSKLILEDNIEGAKQLAQKYKNVWGDDYYIELMWTGYNPQIKQLRHALDIAEKLKIKIAATNDVHYIYKDDAEYQRAKIAISRNRPFHDENSSDEYYLKSYEEMRRRFASHVDALHNTVEIADKCDIELNLGAAQLPHFEVPKDNKEFNEFKVDIWGKKEEESYLIFLAREGLKWRKKWDTEGYRERLEKELETIRITGFIRYFLIVWEYCHWARENSIMIGAGRGSGAGSLVLFCLGVTNIDPIKYDLTMDRFLYAEAKYHTEVNDYFSHIEREKNMHGEKCDCPTCRI